MSRRGRLKKRNALAVIVERDELVSCDRFRHLRTEVLEPCRSLIIERVKQDRPPFDTRQYNHIMWKDTEDLRERLLARIRAHFGTSTQYKRRWLIGRPHSMTPIRLSLPRPQLA